MASMPASRRARAMIFAPRSCPSRPGFAATTRIFLFVAVDMSGCAAHGRRGPGRLIVHVRARPSRLDGDDPLRAVADTVPAEVSSLRRPRDGRVGAESRAWPLEWNAARQIRG